MNFLLKSILIIVPESYINSKTKSSILNSSTIVNNKKYCLTGKDWKKVELKPLKLSLIMTNSTTNKEFTKYITSNELR